MGVRNPGFGALLLNFVDYEFGDNEVTETVISG